MKTIIISAFIALQSTFAFADVNADQIINWDDVIPASQQALISKIQAKAQEEFYYEDDGQACGGQTFEHALTDYYTEANHYGYVTHKLQLEFFVTASQDFCERETLIHCVAPVKVDSHGKAKIQPWNCKPISKRDQ